MSGPTSASGRPPGGGSEDELLALLRWSFVEKVGPRRLLAAVRAIGSARALLSSADAGERLGRPGAEPLSAAEARTVLARCRTHGIRALAWGDEAYPERLLHLDGPPPVLFVRGVLHDPARPVVAVVGARRATAYARRVSRDLARGLAANEVVVVSGMALGVDGEAHRGALEGQGTTVAVLGGGVDRARPTSHRRLYRDILASGGAVIGEWAPETPARPFHFPRRNRILAALSDLVVVVEAGARSGALSTAAHARRLGREVTAVPGPVDRPGHVGANRLIRDGCAPILELRDVLDRLGRPAGPTVERTAPELDAETAPVWEGLAEGPTTAPALARRIGLPPDRVLTALTRLELDGWVRRDRGLHRRSAAA
ncbi:MAG: DNA-processing protein DprA [Gemmatimonadetes bacterium]|nr:DNA-processing protein DprA [Gemmatimonadota bacterium]